MCKIAILKVPLTNTSGVWRPGVQWGGKAW